MDSSIFDALEEEDLLLIAAVSHRKKKRPQTRLPEQNECTKSWKNERDMRNITG